MLKFRDWRHPGVLPGENEAEVPAALAVVDELMRGGSSPWKNVNLGLAFDLFLW